MFLTACEVNSAFLNGSIPSVSNVDVTAKEAKLPKAKSKTHEAA